APLGPVGYSAAAPAVLTVRGAAANSVLTLAGTGDNDNLGTNVASGTVVLGKTQAAANNAVQTLTFSGAASPNFTLTFKGQTTANITWINNDGMLATRISTALAALTTIGGAGNINVVSTGNGTSVTVTFQNTLGGVSQPDLVITFNSISV